MITLWPSPTAADTYPRSGRGRSHGRVVGGGHFDPVVVGRLEFGEVRPGGVFVRPRPRIDGVSAFGVVREPSAVGEYADVDAVGLPASVVAAVPPPFSPVEAVDQVELDGYAVHDSHRTPVRKGLPCLN